MAEMTHEIDASLLTELAHDVDAEHRESMTTLARDMGRVLARRQLFTRVGAAGALAIGAVLATAAPAAAEGPSAPVTADDVTLLGWARSLELAAVGAYDAAIGSKKLSAEIANVAALFQNHHQEHADALGSLAGRQLAAKPNASILAAFGPTFTGAADGPAVLRAAFDLEMAAARTYLRVLGLLLGTDGARLVASIQPTEARHAYVLGQALNLTDRLILPEREDLSSAINPADYPIEGK